MVYCGSSEGSWVKNRKVRREKEIWSSVAVYSLDVFSPLSVERKFALCVNEEEEEEEGSFVCAGVMVLP